MVTAAGEKDSRAAEQGHVGIDHGRSLPKAEQAEGHRGGERDRGDQFPQGKQRARGDVEHEQQIILHGDALPQVQERHGEAEKRHHSGEGVGMVFQPGGTGAVCQCAEQVLGQKNISGHDKYKQRDHRHIEPELSCPGVDHAENADIDSLHENHHNGKIQNLPQIAQADSVGKLPFRLRRGIPARAVGPEYALFNIV